MTGTSTRMESNATSRPQFTLAAVGVFVGLVCVNLALWRVFFIFVGTAEVGDLSPLAFFGIVVLAMCLFGPLVGFTVGYLKRGWNGAVIGVVLGTAAGVFIVILVGIILDTRFF